MHTVPVCFSQRGKSPNFLADVDLRVFDFLEGADTDQGAVAPHGLSAAAAKIRKMKSVTPSISHDKAVQAIISDQI